MTQPIILQKVMEEGLTVTTAISGVILQTFTFVTPFLLHFITKKYVREIYFNPEKDEYTAMTYSILATDKLVSNLVINIVSYEFLMIMIDWDFESSFKWANTMLYYIDIFSLQIFIFVVISF